MHFALTTHWNASRHTDGAAMIREILDLGFDSVELGYDLRPDLIPGVLNMIRDRSVRVVSLHNFCPVPTGAPSGHPELFTPADTDRRVRESAILHITNTVQFAEQVGAGVVVVHAGNVSMERITDQLVGLFQEGKQYGPVYERLKLKLQVQREKKARAQVALLVQSMERLAPLLKETGVKIAFENLPTWESIPTEMEIEALLKQFGADHFGVWYDVGHGQIRETLGFINQSRWLERLQPYLLGMHIHDVLPPVYDHQMPPGGCVDFSRLKPFGVAVPLRVIEPMPLAPAEAILQGVRWMEEAWF